MSSIASLGEQALIERLRQRLGSPPPFVTIGIGDDAAVLAPERGMLEVVTTDSLVEGVHFRREWTPARAIGHKALAVNLSDLAAMGAVPRASLLSLVLPTGFPLLDFDELVDGFASLAELEGTVLVGGNLATSPGPVVIAVTAIGAVSRRRILRRSTARKGDDLYVTGTLGAAAAGLAMLEAGVDRATLDEAAQGCLDRHERPLARTRCGRVVGRSGAASAAIDLSDGLADAARQLAAASGLGIVIEVATLPVDDGARRWADRAGTDAAHLALTGGEDYELAFTVSPRQRRKFEGAMRRCSGLRITRVGRVVADRGAWIERLGQRDPMPDGFVHFVGTSASTR